MIDDDQTDASQRRQFSPVPEPKNYVSVSVVPLIELKFRLRGMLEGAVHLPGTNQSVVNSASVRSIYDSLREIIGE